MNRKPIHARLSFMRFAATAPVLLFGVLALPAWASDPQLQAEVAALQQTVNTLAGQIAALKSTVANQGTQVTNLQKSVIPLLTVVSVDPAHSLVQFRGVNVQIVNGLGTTPTTNGAGNLIIGYNEDDGNARGTCTVSISGYSGYDSFENTCTGDGGTFTRSLGGSHNVVIGSGHGYSSFGGMVVGQDNLISGGFAVVSSGNYNTASGYYSSVSGGTFNTASGSNSSVSGGEANIASGGASSVSGGTFNTASFGDSSVSGGSFNTASSFASSVSGGKSIVEGVNANGWAAGGANTPAFHSP
jgi:hypothetical protein